MFNFILKGLKFFKKLIKICITYACILFCGCLKEKCINNDNEPIIGSPTPLKSDNVKHPVLEAYENKIIEEINNNN